MKRKLSILFSLLILTFCSAIAVNGQEKNISSDQTENVSNKLDTPLKITGKPRPEFDERCVQYGSGTVRLKVTFHESGKITETKIISASSCEFFDRSAEKATRRIRFKPATKNGKPVTLTKTVEYNFGVS